MKVRSLLWDTNSEGIFGDVDDPSGHGRKGVVSKSCMEGPSGRGNDGRTCGHLPTGSSHWQLQRIQAACSHVTCFLFRIRFTKLRRPHRLGRMKISLSYHGGFQSVLELHISWFIFLSFGIYRDYPLTTLGLLAALEFRKFRHEPPAPSSTYHPLVAVVCDSPWYHLRLADMVVRMNVYGCRITAHCGLELR